MFIWNCKDCDNWGEPVRYCPQMPFNGKWDFILKLNTYYIFIFKVNAHFTQHLAFYLIRLEVNVTKDYSIRQLRVSSSPVGNIYSPEKKFLNVSST